MVNVFGVVNALKHRDVDFGAARVYERMRRWCCLGWSYCSGVVGEPDSTVPLLKLLPIQNILTVKF